MHTALDPFDPRYWIEDEYEHRIYGSRDLSIYAVVDPEDYAWFARWLWSHKFSRGGRKCYLYRTDNTNGSHRSLYLHVAIMLRTGIARPTPQHTMADHRNGNGLDCRRHNLRWATPSMNARNINGRCGHDLVEG